MLLQNYNPEWINDFKAIKQILDCTLKVKNIRIEHIGSTSVPGLAAKPIIDIDIVFPSEVEFEYIKKRLLEIGYYHNGNQGIPQREVFKRNLTMEKNAVLDTILHHLYVCPSDSEELKRHVIFRDFLKENEWAKTAYQKLKYEIAEETGQERKAYAQLKEMKARAFVVSILNLAEETI